MIISKDLFIFGEQIFATIIPEGGTALGTQQQQQSQAQQQPAIINPTTTTATTATATASSSVINSTAGAAEQVVESLKAAAAAAATALAIAAPTTTTPTPTAAAAAAAAAAATTVAATKQLPAAAVNTKTSSSSPSPSSSLLLTKQETVAVVAAALPPSSNINSNSNVAVNTNSLRGGGGGGGGGVGVGVGGIGTKKSTTKIQKIPKEAEELKSKKKAHKCEVVKAQAQMQSQLNYAKMPMNLLAQSVEANETASDNEMEQVPLVRRSLAKIVANSSVASAAADCRLQIELDKTLPLPLPTTSKSSTSSTASSTSTSTSSSSSSTASTSSEFTHTSQTTIPSTDNLSANAANLGKSILVAAKSVEPTSLSFPFISTGQEQQQQQAAIAMPQQQQQQQQQQQLQHQQPTLQLTFQNLNVLHNERKILSDVSGLVSPGEVLAIMGPSGSGKTTLLDCLSGQRRFDSGSVYLNREPLSKKWRRRIGYVLQEEIFFTQLTLRETVMYTALLRLSESISRSEKLRLVDHILETLELSLCQQTKFGDYMNRGLSGGEKKRANIACELLTNPLLMLLDEPTSGLDSHSAISLMKVLKRYAQQEQKTIVITVHQPSSQMFHMFDKLLLLHQGRTAYFGEVQHIYRHFEDIGVAIKPHYNPADFVLEQLKSYPDIREKLFIAAKESHGNYLNRNHQPVNAHQQTAHNNGMAKPQDVSDKTKQHDSILINDIINNYYNYNHHQHQYENLNHRTSACEAEEAAQHLVWCGNDSQSNFSSCASSDCQSYSGDAGQDWLAYPTRFHTQFRVLSSRNFKEAKPRMLSKLNWFQTIGLALMAGAIWFQLPRTEEFLHDLQGWMFFSQTYWMLFALFGALNSFPSEREVISKERRSGAYRLSAYYLAKMFGELPLVITLPTVYLMISYPMLGCTSLKLFFLMLIFLLLNTIVAQSVGFFIGACCMDMNVSITLSALYTLATQLFGGYLSSRIPEGLSWIRYTSMIHYAYQNMQILEFREGPAISCGRPSSYEICKQHATEFIPYEEILKAQNSTSPLWLNTLILMMFFLVFRGLGYAVLRFVRCPKKT